MPVHLVGQTHKQKKNAEEQKKRRDSIKGRFPKTITFHTYESIEHKIVKQQDRIHTAFGKLQEKLRKSELKSLAITYYIHTYNNKKKSDKLEFIYTFLEKNNSTLEDLLDRLDNKYPRKNGRKWNREVVLNYLLFKK